MILSIHPLPVLPMSTKLAKGVYPRPLPLTEPAARRSRPSPYTGIHDDDISTALY